EEYEQLIRQHEDASHSSAMSLTGSATVEFEGRAIEINVASIVKVGQALTMETITADSGNIEPRVFGLTDTDDSPKWNSSELDSTVMGWVQENKIVLSGSLHLGQASGLVLDKTCFYAEAGGQTGDKVTISTSTGRFEVAQTLRIGRTII